jgi:tricorn protease
MKKAFLLALTLVLLTGFGYSMQDVRLLRHPDINNDLVVFVYAGDIWSAPVNGGDAVRLTSHKGLEIFPRISPDGKWIAFSGEYSGTRQIFVIPRTGGTPKQLTYYNDVGIMPPRGGWDNIPLDWTPDSKQILFRANRTPYGRRNGKYYLVGLEGGMETALQIPEGGLGSFSPDAKSMTFTPICREFRTWKRTKGGRAQDVWTYDLVDNTSKRLTTFTGTDHHPTWYKDKIFYVSDRSLVLNFWSYDLKTGNKKQITDFKDFDVLWPSGQGGKIAFEKGGYINILDLDSGAAKKLTINLHFDNPNRLPYFKEVKGFISRFGGTLSPEGKRVIFDARGDLFSVPAKKGVTVNLTRTQGIREMYPVWSPDGKWIAYVSDKSGDFEIYLMDPEQKKATVQLTTNHSVWKYPVTWSPDSKKVVFADMDRKLQVMDIASKQISQVDKGFLGNITDYEWSGDSNWLVYTKAGKNKLSNIYVYSLAQKKSFSLSTGRYNDYSPVFSQDGKHLFFISDRDFTMNFQKGFSAMEFDFVYPETSRMYVLALTKDAPHLFKEDNDLEQGKKPGAGAEKAKKAAKKKAGKDKGAKDKKKEAKPVKIDFDGILDRVTVFPLTTGNYQVLIDLGGGKIAYGKGRETRVYDLESKKDNLVITGVRPMALSADSKKLLYRARGKYGIIGFKPKQKPGAGALDLSGLVMKIDPVKEWKQIFYEGWRIYRDWFYVRNMHGVDWPAMKKKYEALLPYLGHRADLDYIFGELVGELNAGHTYVNWGDFETVERVEGGLLGADLIADKKAGRYKIAKIYKGENWNRRTRSPLTEPGVDVKEGDYIIALNGYDVTLKDNPYRFLENTANKKITITVNKAASKAGARTGWIKPIRSEIALLTLDWVESRRKLVDKLSGGRIGYIFVPNTAVGGNRELFKGVYSFNDKEAFIIDDRYNGGGWTPVKMIEKLTQRTYSYWYRRGLAMRQAPLFALRGPMVMLINHYSSSGGDNFPYWFRFNKLGKLIGTRTWGGLIGYGWSPGLVDGPRFAVPMSGIVNLKGEFAVEGTGVAPDEGFEVIDRPEEIAKGNDPTLEKGVKYLLEQLKKKPAKKVKKPVDPDRSKWHEQMRD